MSADWAKFAKRYEREADELQPRAALPAADTEPTRVARRNAVRARNAAKREAREKAVAAFLAQKESVASRASGADSTGAQRLQTQSPREQVTRVFRNSQNSRATEKKREKSKKAHDKWAAWMFKDGRKTVSKRAAGLIAPKTVRESDLCIRCHWVSSVAVGEHGDSSTRVREQELVRAGFSAGDGGWYRFCVVCALATPIVSALLDAEWKPTPRRRLTVGEAV